MSTVGTTRRITTVRTVTADVVDREDVIDHLIGIAEQRGTEVKFISSDFEKGEQLYNAFGGIAGILRYSTGV